ncbi:MAG: hypothetical protein D6685_12615, partial [Bacteroidetes bacterium]
MHGNAVTVEYWSGHCTEAGLADDACPYPEAIRHIASVQHPEMEITTTLWTESDAEVPEAVGMLKDLIAKGFGGQTVTYRFHYGREAVHDDLDGDVYVAVLTRVDLPAIDGQPAGTIEYGYRWGFTGTAPGDPGFGPLLDRVAYPLGGESRYEYGTYICGSRTREDKNGIPKGIKNRSCVGVKRRAIYREGFAAGSPAVWSWSREFRETNVFDCHHSTPETVANSFRVHEPDGRMTESKFYGHPCGGEVLEGTKLTGWVKSETVYGPPEDPDGDGTATRQALRRTDYTYDYFYDVSVLNTETREVMVRDKTVTFLDDTGGCFGDGSPDGTPRRMETHYRD